MKFFLRFVDSINMCLDMDAAGREGVRSLIKYHGNDFKIQDIRYPCITSGDKDLGDLWKRVGDVNFSKYFAEYT
jgi:hypothetical protein